MNIDPGTSKARDEAVDQVDESRRSFIHKITKAAYAVPALTTFGLTTLASQPALAQCTNQTIGLCSVPAPPTTNPK